MISLHHNFWRYTFLLVFGLFLVCVSVSVPAMALAQPTPTINYQGKLSDNLGATVADGTYNMRFWLLTSDVIATTSAVWTESLTGANQVSVQNGLFSVMLGSTSPLTSVDFNQPLYLGVEIGGTGAPAWDGEMLPRKPLGTVPAAFQAEEANNAQTLGGVASTSFLRSDTADTMSAAEASTLFTIQQNGTGDILNVLASSSQSTFFVGADGNVGVGTSSPAGLFTVHGVNPVIDIRTPGVNPSQQYVALELVTFDQGGELGFGGDKGWSIAAISDSFSSTALQNDFSITYADGSGSSFSALKIDSATQNIGIGTSSPSSKLSIAGDTYITGALRDNNYSAGSNGMVLQSTGAGFAWVATSSLGIGGGSSITFGTDNQIPFTNTAGDDYDYSSNFTFDGSQLTVTGGVNIVDALSANGGLTLNGVPLVTGSTTANNFFFAGATSTSFASNSNYNFAFGEGALNYLGAGASDNIAIGNNALRGSSTSPLTSTGNVALGKSSLESNVSGSYNNALGIRALEGNTSGTRNNAFGRNTLVGNTSGSDNNAFGGFALVSNTTGRGNNALGYFALSTNGSGSDNTAIGADALAANTIGNSNIAVGQFALTSNVDGLGNIGVGSQALAFNNGTGSIAIGYQAANNATAVDRGIFIGYDIDAFSTTEDNVLNIGNLIFGQNVDGTGTTLSSGNIGIGTSSPSSKLTIAGDTYIGGALRATGTVQFDALTDGLLLADGSGNLSAIATSSLGITTQILTLGTDNQIPFMNSGDTDFEYSDNFTFNGTDLNLGQSNGIAFDGTRMFYASTTNDSVAIGEEAGANFTSATMRNVAIGFEAGNNASTSNADDNNYIGYLAGSRNTAAYNNIFGIFAGFSNTGQDNNLIGRSAGVSNTGIENNIFGRSAGSVNTGWSNNIFGPEAGWFNTGDYNNLIGDSAGENNTGSSNNALGFDAGNSNSGNYNNFLGEATGAVNTGSYINAFGRSAGHNNTGSYSEFIGFETGGRMSASSTVAIGGLALRGGSGSVFSGNNATTTNNTVIGYGAGYNVLTGGDNNLLLGYQAADSLTTGANNIIIGYDVEAPSNTADGQLNIGNLIFGQNVDGTGTTLSSGNIGIGTSSPLARLTVESSATNDGIIVSNTNAASTGSGIGVMDETGSLKVDFGFNNSLDEAYIWTYGSDPLKFGTNNTERMRLDSVGNIGIGTSSPDARLTLQTDTLDGAGIAGLSQYLTTENTVDAAAQYGNYFNLNASNTATTTIVGSIYRVADNTTFGNTVRGLEVQTNRGSNTQGENTALSGFARTFGVRGVTSGDAGSAFEPAGGFFETEGSTQGNAIRGFSSSITSASLLSLFQDTSDFTGTGLEMNFGNTTGDFSSSSSKYIDFQNGGTSVFTVSAFGTTTIGDGTTNNFAGLQIGYGGICVDNDGSCIASTTGRISAVEYNTANSDLAEMYFSSTNLEPGEIVTLAGELSVDRAEQNSALPILGVVSTKPGLTLGSDDTSLTAGETGFPIALSGRVPIKLSTENGPIKKGDELMLSSLPGIAMKATGTGVVVGIALEDFTESRMYSDTYLNQFADDMVDPIYEPVTNNTDPRINDGCYYGGGNAAGETDCIPLTSTTSADMIAEVNSQMATESVAEQIQILKNKRSDTRTLTTGGRVRVGQIVMFVDTKYRWLTPDMQLALEDMMEVDSRELRELLEQDDDSTAGLMASVVEAVTTLWNKVTGIETKLEQLETENESLRQRLEQVEEVLGTQSATPAGTHTSGDQTETETETEEIASDSESSVESSETTELSESADEVGDDSAVEIVSTTTATTTEKEIVSDTISATSTDTSSESSVDAAEEEGETSIVPAAPEVENLAEEASELVDDIDMTEPISEPESDEEIEQSTDDQDNDDVQV